MRELVVSFFILALSFVFFIISAISRAGEIGDLNSKLKIKSQDYDELNNKYSKLMRAYMSARKKLEIETIPEVENLILRDYEWLGSKTIPSTQYIASAMADYYTSQMQEGLTARCRANWEIKHAKNLQYAFERGLVNLLNNHPELLKEYASYELGVSVREAESISVFSDYCFPHFIENISLFQTLRDSAKAYKKEFTSNLTAIPYMSRIAANIMTIDIERLAWALSWGNNKERQKKVASLNELKKKTAEEIERIKIAEYQLAYLLELYPALQDVIDTEFSELNISFDDVSDCDPARHYMEHEEWEKLSSAERNQLALDRYVESRRKSKWQIGRDYELYCGHVYEKKGWSVDYFGSYNGLEDLGRDLILTKDGNVKIVQCKYWSHTKQIHENHIMQLYGSVIEYNLENKRKATGTLVTNTTLSEKAKDFARVLGIEYKENYALGDFPRIKCNIGRGERGEKTKIYHLPFDQQYDSAKVEHEGEFMAMTVAEAEKAGFRRAYKWHGEE